MHIDRFEQARLDKLHKIVDMGRDPFGQRFDDHLAIAAARALCPQESGVLGEDVRIAVGTEPLTQGESCAR